MLEKTISTEENPNRTHTVSIMDTGTALVLTMLLMFDQFHDFGETADRNQIPRNNVKNVMNSLKSCIQNFIDDKGLMNYFSEKNISEKNKKARDYLKIKYENVMKENNIKELLKNKYELSAEFLEFCGIRRVNFENFAEDYLNIGDEIISIGCSEAVDILKIYLNFLRITEQKKSSDERYYLFVDAYKSNIRISPLLYNLCDLIFSPFRGNVKAFLVKTIGTMFDSATDPGTQKYIERLITAKENKIKKLRTEISEATRKNQKNISKQTQLSILQSKKIEIETAHKIREGENTYKKKYIVQLSLPKTHNSKSKIIKLCEFDLEISKKKVKINLKDYDVIYKILKLNAKERESLWEFMKEKNYNISVGWISKTAFKNVRSKDYIISKIENEYTKLIDNIKQRNSTKSNKDLDIALLNKKKDEKLNKEVEKNEKLLTKLKKTIDVWKKIPQCINYEKDEDEIVKVYVQEWFGLKRDLLKKVHSNLYSDDKIKNLSVEHITSTLKNKHTENLAEWAPYYFPFKTIGDFSQVLDCYHFKKLHPKRVSPLFLTFDRIAGFISSMFNRTIFESSSNENLISLETFVYADEKEKYENFNRADAEGVEALLALYGNKNQDIGFTRSQLNTPAGSKDVTPAGSINVTSALYTSALSKNVISAESKNVTSAGSTLKINRSRPGTGGSITELKPAYKKQQPCEINTTLETEKQPQPTLTPPRGMTTAFNFEKNLTSTSGAKFNVPLTSVENKSVDYYQPEGWGL